MTTRFNVLCTIELAHAYYGGACRDLAFVVPADTAATLRRGRLLARMLDGRLFILFEADEQGHPLVSLAGAVVRIGLRLANPLFGNFTALGFPTASAVAVYRTGGTGQLSAPLTAVPTGRFLVRRLARPDRPVEVSLENAEGHGPEPATVVGAADRADVSFDLEGFAPGAYVLTEQYQAGPPEVSTYYLDPELVRESLLGVVEVTILSAFYAAAVALQVAFAARSETLRYYVVASHHTDAEFAQLSVTHAPASGPPAFTFTKVLPPAFVAAEIPGSMLASGDDKVALFRSDAPVARRAGGYQRVQLTRNGDVVIGNLPQAAPERPNADLIVHLSKPKP